VKAVLQRVSKAAVRVEGSLTGKIGPGLLVLLGVEKGDTREEARYLAEKTIGMRIFPDQVEEGSAAGPMNLGVLDSGGSILVVSQFTLAADTRRGKRPSFSGAAPPELAEPLYLFFVECLRAGGVTVETGIFQAMMDVELTNQGPVTILLEAPRERL
jgi:D-tyrosyl-tRNA(Tyr) deacylase